MTQDVLRTTVLQKALKWQRPSFGGPEATLTEPEWVPAKWGWKTQGLEGAWTRSFARLGQTECWAGKAIQEYADLEKHLQEVSSRLRDAGRPCLVLGPGGSAEVCIECSSERALVLAHVSRSLQTQGF